MFVNFYSYGLVISCPLNYRQILENPTPMSGYAKVPLPASGEGLGVGFCNYR
ncbi:hypothetical protein NIES4073_43430 [Kalymmatonema gypsitolerans NIES-4073]|nr:hypothetical protein NIES4073_43430 [Scytonema sp. NIES-4073]